MSSPTTNGKLVCVGNITIDEAVQPDGSRVTSLGGDAIFAALAARLAGADAAMLAPIGNDFPAELAEQLTGAGLDLVQPRRDLPTVRNVIRYATDGTRRWEMQCSEDDFDAMSVHPDDVPSQALAATGLLVLAMSLVSQLTLTPWLREHSDATIYLDLQEDYIIGHEDELLELVRSSHVFLPSEVEATRLTGLADAARAAQRLAELGPDVVVIKRAERGCLVLADGHVTEVPTDAVDAVDPTGAGDAFCGAFAAAHLAGRNAVEAARLAAGIAGLAVTGPGVLPLLAAATGSR